MPRPQGLLTRTAIGQFPAHARLPAHFYDLHVFDVLLRIQALLAPGGVLLVVTPNEGGIVTRARLALRRPRRLVATVPPPHHLHSFAPVPLRRTLTRAGFEPLRTFTTSPTNWRYVTSHNLARAQGHPALRPLWAVGASAGMGAVLVTWSRPR